MSYIEIVYGFKGLVIALNERCNMVITPVTVIKPIQVFAVFQFISE